MKEAISSGLAENRKRMAVWVAAGVALLAVGCSTTKEPEVGLLGPRRVVPAPLTEPQAGLQPGATTEPIVMEPVTPGEEKPAIEAPALPEIKSAITTYKVKSGDSFWKIAWTHGVSDKELAEFNNMKLTDTLRIGKTLSIPPGGKHVSLEKRPMPKHAKATPKKVAGVAVRAGSPKRATVPIPAGGKYTVQKNDNLWTVARKFDVKSADIRTANNLQTDRLDVGQVLTIPRGGSPTVPVSPVVAPDTGVTAPGGMPPDTAVPPGTDVAVPPAGDVAVPPTAPVETGVTPPAAGNTLPHVVVQNETLESIADMYDTKVEEILKTNPQIKGNPDLKPNITLQIPMK